MFCVLIGPGMGNFFAVAPVSPVKVGSMKSVAALVRGLVLVLFFKSPPLHSTPLHSTPLHPAHETPLPVILGLDTLHKSRGESFVQVQIHSLMSFVLIS